jgi:DNA adenine methylase
MFPREVMRYDRARTFFYLDPPYYLAPFYEHNLELEDYREMAEILAKLKARFILSINDHPEMRNIFKKFKKKHVTLKYSVSEKQATVGKELLVSNF